MDPRSGENGSNYSECFPNMNSNSEPESNSLDILSTQLSRVPDDITLPMQTSYYDINIEIPLSSLSLSDSVNPIMSIDQSSPSGGASETVSFNSLAASSRSLVNTMTNPGVPGVNQSEQFVNHQQKPEPELRIKLVIQQLILILHAFICQKRENNAKGEPKQCTLPHCQTFKDVHNHIRICKDGKSCQYKYCVSSQTIIRHWKNCISEDCKYCGPIKEHDRLEKVKNSR